MSTRMPSTLWLALAFTVALAATPLSATDTAYPALGAKLRAQALAKRHAGAPPEDVVAGLTRAALMDPGAPDTWSALADAVGRLHPSARTPTRAEQVAWRIAEQAGAAPAAAIAAAPAATPRPVTEYLAARRAEAIQGRTGTVRRILAGARARAAAAWARVQDAPTWAVLRLAARNWARDFRDGMATLHPYRPSLVLLALTLLSLLAWARSRQVRSAPRTAPATPTSRFQEARRLAHSGARHTDVARSTGLARDAIEMLMPAAPLPTPQPAPRPDRTSVSGRNFRAELARHGVRPGRLNHVIA